MSGIKGVHPHAECYPLLSDDELAALADDIRENGLRDPVTVTPDGWLIDGRNRSRACELIGIEPETVVYEGSDIGAFVRSRNMRRHQPVGSLAMSTALSMHTDGFREGGRWKRGSLDASNQESLNSDWKNKITQAGVVLDFKPDLAPAVVAGDMALDAAFREADAIRKSAERDKVLERERRKREREEAAAEAERHAQIVADLTAAESRFLASIEDGSMSPAVAWAAHLEDTRKERERQAAIEQGWRDTNVRVAECVRSLAAQAPGEGFLAEFYPHHDRYVVEGMRLTRERCEDAITFLQALVKEMNR